MIIEDKREEEVDFVLLSVGQVFISDNNFYMKILETTGRDDNIFNAIDLRSTVLCCFDSYDSVTAVSAKLAIS